MLKKNLIAGTFIVIFLSVCHYANKTGKEIFNARIKCNKLKIIDNH